MLDHYTHTAQSAAQLIKADPTPLELAAPPPGVRPEEVATVAEALAWFAAEHRVLMAVTAEATRTGSDTHGWILPAITSVYLTVAGYWHEYAASQYRALESARRLRDRAPRPTCTAALGTR
jgi:hypothetical protein